VQKQAQAKTAVVAVAGRRVDAPGADPARFPLENVPGVRHRIAECLEAEAAAALVSSAACGVDLLALDEAERLSLRRRIILPFSPERFRESSVVDRPGNWGAMFDRHTAAAMAGGDLVVLDFADGGDPAYAGANEAIVREAQALAQDGALHRLVALTVWDGTARRGTDATADFRRLASKASFKQMNVSTL